MERVSYVKRKTLETDISVEINLDGKGKSEINTGVGFFDHMLTLFSKHGNFDLKCMAIGDLHIDAHHTVEDVGLSLGETIKKALDDKKGINRYGTFYVPMMEALVRVSLDLSGRPFLFFDYIFKNEKVGEFDTELTKEFFISIVNVAGINMHIDVIRGENTHHIIEAIFKAFARALSEACSITGEEIPSSKGII